MVENKCEMDTMIGLQTRINRECCRMTLKLIEIIVCNSEMSHAISMLISTDGFEMVENKREMDTMIGLKTRINRECCRMTLK